MISRRNIRVKAMQSLFTDQTNDFWDEKATNKQFDQSIQDFFSLYNYILYCTIQVADFVHTDAEIKASKFLIQENEKEVNAKILDNEAINFLKEDEKFQSWVKKAKPKHLLNKSIIQSAYQQLLQNERYQEYLANPMDIDGSKTDVEILEQIIFDTLLNNEVFVEHLQDNFVNIQDDGLEVERMLRRNLKKAAKKQNFSYINRWNDEKLQEVSNFGKELISTTRQKADDFDDEYQDYLQNWDSNRLAVIDKLLLQMALTEMIYFPEIPVKVTLNEYIDIAKEYSTPKSKEFINGVLDRIMKEFTKSGKIVKTGRGLMN